MSEVAEKILFDGVLNTDDSPRNLPKGDYPDSMGNRIHVTEKGKDGDVENIKGNLLVANVLPAGTNKTIGTYEDKARKRIIYCNWNSNGNHGIYQYYTEQNSIETILVWSGLDFNVNSKITAMNVVEAQTGDLFFFSDNWKHPRKININKAVENKNREYNIFYKNDPALALNTSFTATSTVKDAAGATLLTWQVTIQASTIEDIIKAYLAAVPVSPLITVSTCYQFLTATLIGQLNTLEVSTSALPFSQQRMVAVAKNFYPSPFREEFIDAIKYPTICQPNAVPKQDATRVINLVQNKVFQFRLKLIYDDNEKSVWSPYSTIPDLPISCGASSTQSSFNYLEIDFNSEVFSDVPLLSLIDRMDIAVREHNTGKLQYITTIQKWQFILNNGTYNFYNDIITSVVDPAEELKNYDSLPLLAKSQELVNNRLFYGGITEGYDPVCVDAKINLSYDPPVSAATFSFTGRIFIHNLFANQSDYRSSQPIHRLNNGGSSDYVFGGFGNSDVANAVGTAYQQRIPLGGFVVYLAGTNHYGISRQPIFPTYGIQQDANNVMNSDNSGNALILSCSSNNIANAKQKKKIRCQIENGGIWSVFSISNVPPGKYALRVASHLLTQADLNSASLEWQNTSTYTMNVAGSSSVGGKNEAILEIKTNGDIYIDGVFIATANGSIPDTHIADLTDPRVTSASIGISGYITDADITPTPATGPGLLQDTRIDLARVDLDFAAGSGFLGASVISTLFLGAVGIALVAWNAYTAQFKKGVAYTDHNGFFWWASIRPTISFNNLKVKGINVAGNAAQPNGYDLNAAPFVPSGAAQTSIGIFRAPSSSLFNNQRTILQGNVGFNSQPISGINIVNTRGSFDKTDPNGDFNIVAYADTKNYEDTGSGTVGRQDQILFAVDDNCTIVFASNAIAYNILIGSGQYNYTSPYPVTGITILSVLGAGALSGLKRGGSYEIGFVYFDEALRDNNVSTSDALKLKIPFYTEYVPNTTTIVGQGRPIVEVEINHTPPPWATHYQVVRTLNGNQGRYLQWSAKTVTYVDADGNPTSFSAAAQVKIDLESLIDYKARNLDSQVAYTFEEGDRLVLIKNGSTGNFYSSYQDFKIKGSKTGASLILYIDNLVSVGQIPIGTLFEIYNPLKKQSVNLFYEIGECYEIANGLHKGNIQDQTSSQPAKVKLTHGDAYYRLRTIPFNSNNVIGAVCNNQKTWFIEDASISDFYKSDDQSIGRAHIFNKDLGRRYRPSVIRFSNTFLPETKINGLNSFEGLNEKVLPLDYGLIEKLIMAKDVLCSIHHNSEFLTMYIGKQVFLDQALQSVVAVSDKVIQSSYQYNGGLGTQNPESICMDEDNIVYGYDNNKGIVWQRNVNGLIPISEVKMWTYWRNKSNEIKAGGGTFVYGAYDNSFKQYILSIEGTPTARPSIVGDTIAYSKKKQGWESRYPFQPEYFGGAKNNVLVCFLNGALWRQEANPLYNNFFGVQYTSKLKAVTRELPSDMKNFQYISLESSHPWKTTAGGIVTMEGQISELNKSDFELIEHVFRAAFLRDINTPNITPPALPIFEGDDLRSSSIIIELENTETVYSTLDAVNVYSMRSQSTNK